MEEDNSQPESTRRRFLRNGTLVAGSLALGVTATGSAAGQGVAVANGWYEEEEEIYYIAHGVEEGVTERGENDIYLIGGDRAYQAQVVEFIPGEPGYSPHWNVNVVHTAEGVTTSDIAGSEFASDRFDSSKDRSQGPLFDDLEDIFGGRGCWIRFSQETGSCGAVPNRARTGGRCPREHRII